jgi:aminoglycoside phosphotransferase family enzyme/predicted kinase
VFLAGERAFKLKRSVKLAFLDFSTIELREQACQVELELNRRTAPELYLGLRKITRESDGRLTLDGSGEIIDWLVEMRRFPEQDRLDQVAMRGELTKDRIAELAETIAAFHASALKLPEKGGAVGLAWVIDNNRQAFAGPGGGIFSPREINELCERQTKWLARLAPLLEARREAGFVRQCHGDLHLANICLFKGKLLLFDGIEFSQEIPCIDVLYDLAFLVMDLENRGFKPAANLLLSHYIGVTGDVGGLAALPLFLSLRAAVRAHVGAATAATITDQAAIESAQEAAKAYLARAFSYLTPSPARLIAVGGLSGSGKSRLAREIAPSIGASPGALVLRSDVIRKRLAGVNPLVRLEAAAYGAEMTERTYATLYDQTDQALAAGHTVIADAVFAMPEQRSAMAEIAEKRYVDFIGLWVEAPFEVLAERIEKRRGNASDATVEVLKKQMDYDLGEIDWQRIDSSGPREESLAQALKLL